MSRLMLLTIVWFASSSLVGAADLPKLRINHPLAVAKYSSFSNMTFMGQIDPQLDTEVRIRLYQVRDDGKLFQLTGTTAKINEAGMFLANLEPSGKGWPSGKVRVEVRVEGLSQLRELRTVEIVQSHDTPPDGHVITEIIDSGIIVDTAKPNGPYQIIGGQTFLIRGQFEKKDGRHGNQGPRVNVEIVLPANTGKNPEITYQSASAISLPDEQPDHFWYEVAIVAPEKPQAYKLRVNCNWAGGEAIVPPKQPKDGFDLVVGP
ncbi:MAG: hypothetical protein AABP62_18215 [Planctomycetota bacterium]